MRHCRAVKQFKTKCENLRACLVASKESLILFRRVVGTSEEQIPNLIVKTGKFQRLVKVYLRQSLLCEGQGHVWGNMARQHLDGHPWGLWFCGHPELKLRKVSQPVLLEASFDLIQEDI